MTTADYESLKSAIMQDNSSNGHFHWELLKALWAIERALKQGLEE